MSGPTVVLLMVLSATAGTVVGPGASAAFTSSRTATTGTLTMATMTGSFANGTNDVGGSGGTGGSSYVMTGGTVATTTNRYTTLTNTGSTTLSYAGTLTAQGLSGTITATVDACSIAWAAGLCGGTTTSLLASTSIATAPTVSYGSLAMSGVLYLRYRFTAGSITPSATTFTALATPSGTASNRTAG